MRQLKSSCVKNIHSKRTGYSGCDLNVQKAILPVRVKQLRIFIDMLHNTGYTLGQPLPVSRIWLYDVCHVTTSCSYSLLHRALKDIHAHGWSID